MQVPGANARSANSSFDSYPTNQTIQETWNIAQENVIKAICILIVSVYTCTFISAIQSNLLVNEG